MHVHRWKTAEPAIERVAKTRRNRVKNIFCNDTHAFCGKNNGTIEVFNLKSGELERELVPPGGAMGPPVLVLHGGEEVVAAALVRRDVVVWSSQGEMEQLHLYDVASYNCSEVSCDHEGFSKSISRLLVVDRNKVAILLKQYDPRTQSADPFDSHFKFSLLLLKKVNEVWECKGLGCYPGARWCYIASGGAWLALAVEGEEKIRLWHGSNESHQDICLPESVHNLAHSDSVPAHFACMHSMRECAHTLRMFIEIPHIIFNVGAGDIKVLKMAATQLHLVKSIRLPRSSDRRPIDNQFCLGFLQRTNDGDTIVQVFQKRELFDPDLSPEETEGRRIEAGTWTGRDPVNINTTSILWQREEVEGEYWMGLVKKDFWI